MLQLKFFRSHENLEKSESPVVIKGTLPYSYPKSTVLSGKPCPFKICFKMCTFRKNLASCALPGVPTVKFKKRLLYLLFEAVYLCLKL